MAISNIEKDLNEFLKKMKNGKHKEVHAKLDDILPLGKWHKVTMSYKRVSDGMIIANSRALVLQTGMPKAEVDQLLNSAVYTDAFRDAFDIEVDKFSTKHDSILQGDMFISKEYGLIMKQGGHTKAQCHFYIQPDNKIDYKQFVKMFRDNMQESFFDITKTELQLDFGTSNYKVSHKGQRKYLGSATQLGRDEIQGGVEAAHTRGKLLSFVELRAEQVQANIPAGIVEYDLMENLLAELKWTWKEDENLKGNPSTWSSYRAIGIKPGSNPITPYDGQKAIRKILRALKNVKADITGALDPQSAAFYKGSKPFAEKVKDASKLHLVKAIEKKNKKRITKKKIRTKVPKPKKGTKKLKTNLTSKIKKSNYITAGSIKVAKKGKEKGGGKEASTFDAAELARLKKYIQGRLPAEVRRNMGRPALINRTGRFSNSVQLLSLTEAQNSIMARYTYLLSPYQTFENTGRKRWPLAYNPKPLIAKSIRNLAQGRIDGKLSVRRV